MEGESYSLFTAISQAYSGEDLILKRLILGELLLQEETWYYDDQNLRQY